MPLTLSPLSVSTRHRFAASSNAALVIARLERHVATQIEAVGDVIGIAQDLGLGGVTLRPFPLLLQLGEN